ncbi:anaerobic ribonucleoside-triphosphate reductase activating protein [Aliidiomarina indica]|uniref:anaerobic ribonucleoside-triphosphate reductase activating protein n=1 Tax=Aliidiomarina indica TaxID=2749147 RepID=UPI001E513EFF|nr:anaerobic ribonucleoside-triphosphate reductase activating protein [Aliidiomarina indica]
MRFSEEQIVWQEVPGQTSLAYTITGCNIGCKGCHSTHTWPIGSGELLSERYFRTRLDAYDGLITCVLFLGGEWHQAGLIKLLKIAREKRLKTCLYTGLERVPATLLNYLDYVKLGPWMASRGGLAERGTNQTFINVITGDVENYKFWS